MYAGRQRTFNFENSSTSPFRYSRDALAGDASPGFDRHRYTSWYARDQSQTSSQTSSHQAAAANSRGLYLDSEAIERSFHEASDGGRPYSRQESLNDSYQQGPGKATDTSQYSTNNTLAREQQLYPLDAEQPSMARPADSYLYRNMPTTPTRNRSPSPMGSAMRKSPLRSPISKQSAMLLDTCPQLETHGIYIDELKSERVVTTEMLRAARNYSEIAKLIKNSLLLLRRDAPGNSNLVAQMSSKIDYFRSEANESKRRLREIHSVDC